MVISIGLAYIYCSGMSEAVLSNETYMYLDMHPFQPGLSHIDAIGQTSPWGEQLSRLVHGY